MQDSFHPNLLHEHVLYRNAFFTLASLGLVCGLQPDRGAARAARGAQPHHALQCRPCRARACGDNTWLLVWHCLPPPLCLSANSLNIHKFPDGKIQIDHQSKIASYPWCKWNKRHFRWTDIHLLYFVSIMWGIFFLNMTFLRYSVPTQENTNSVKNFEYRLNLDNYSNILFILLFN